MPINFMILDICKGYAPPSHTHTLVKYLAMNVISKYAQLEHMYLHMVPACSFLVLFKKLPPFSHHLIVLWLVLGVNVIQVMPVVLVKRKVGKQAGTYVHFLP